MSNEDKFELHQYETGCLGASSELMADQNMASEPSAASISPQKLAPQSAFDQLQTQKSYRPSASSSNVYSKSKGRVEDLKLEKQYQERSLAQKQRKDSSKLKSKKQAISRRKESNVLPELATVLSTSNNKPEKKDKSLRINMFESEIDAFEFSLLESGHFVLYRKVWRNGVRYIQGLLINPDYFIKNIIEKSFYETNVSNASNLTIAYQGNILSTLDRKSSRRSYSSSIDSQGSGELQGTLLLQKKLSATSRSEEHTSELQSPMYLV